MKVEGKAALITGGAQGLGKAYTKILLQHGAKVSFFFFIWVLFEFSIRVVLGTDFFFFFFFYK